jgi:hypothetical protein
MRFGISSDERKNLILKVASDLDLRFDIVEKDIWVYYALQKLLKKLLVFIWSPYMRNGIK